MFDFLSLLQSHGITYRENLFLRDVTYFKRGGICKLYVMPFSVDQLVTVIEIMNKFEQDYKVVGGTANVLFCDEDFYGTIISTSNIKGISQTNDSISVCCGESVKSFVNYCSINGIAGFEGLEGIPGTMGGAIFMNAGAYGYEVSDHIISVTFLNKNGKLCEADKMACKFDYRYSIFRDEPLVILSAKFHMQLTDSRLIREKISKYHIARHVYQEWSTPTLGSLISIDKDIYAEVFSGTRYSLICFLLKLIFKNRLSKFLSRKNPNNKIFNFLVKRFMKKYCISLGNINYKTIQFSEKSMNILVNSGTYSDQDYVDHINLVSKMVGMEYTVENELIRGWMIEKK